VIDAPTGVLSLAPTVTVHADDVVGDRAI